MKALAQYFQYCEDTCREDGKSLPVELLKNGLLGTLIAAFPVSLIALLVELTLAPELLKPVASYAIGHGLIAAGFALTGLSLVLCLAYRKVNKSQRSAAQENNQD